MVRRLTISLCLTVACAGTFQLSRAAAAEQFPYEAVVVGEKVEVRCGPGNNFYVTSLCRQDDRVTVHRHDHGGWYMIAPPTGSFSLIETQFVEKSGGNRGIVTLPPDSGQSVRALVRIGSQVGHEHSFYGRELSHGDEVTILGEQSIEEGGRRLKMFKIAPPAQEFRWMKGEFLVPLSRQIQQQLAVDPYQVPAEHRQRLALIAGQEIARENPHTTIAQAAPAAPPETKTASLSAPELTSVAARQVPELIAPQLAASASENSSSSPGSAIGSQQARFARLQEIDRMYAEMMTREPADWQLEPIINAYEELKNQVSPGVAELIAERLDVARKRQEIGQHYRKFIQVSVETSQRDAQLLAQRSTPPSQPLEAPIAFGDESDWQTVTGGSEIPSAEPSSFPSPQGVSPQLNGAGILHRMQASPGIPAYVLVAPDGRLLAYVEPGEGVSLEDWVGQPAGIVGRRQREARLDADLIRAQKIVPIQLAR